MKLSHVTALALLVSFLGAGSLVAEPKVFQESEGCTNDIIAVAIGNCASTDDGIRQDCQGRMPSGCTAKAPPSSTCTEQVNGYTLYCVAQTTE